MSDDKAYKHVDDAERAIGAILQKLERMHPSYCVTDIGLKSIETTTFSSDRETLQRRVVIELTPNAFNEWVT